MGVVWSGLCYTLSFLLFLTSMTSHQLGDFSYHYFLSVPELAFLLDNCQLPAGEEYKSGRKRMIHKWEFRGKISSQ